MYSVSRRVVLGEQLNRSTATGSDVDYQKIYDRGLVGPTSLL